MGNGGQRKKKNKGWTAAAAAAASPGLSGQMMMQHHEKAVISRIMLRFRPIAPKPATDGSVSDSSKSNSATVSQLAKRRPKRRYVRANTKNNNNNNNNNSSSSRRRCKPTEREEEKGRDLRFEESDVVCLQTAQHTGEIGSTTGKMISFFGQSIPMGKGSNNNDNLGLGLGLGLGLSLGSDRAVMESWVVVNGMTETTMLGGGEGILGSTDREKMRNLEADTCPGLISDGLHRVQWVNRAYRRMVTDPGVAGAAEEEVEVWLVLKEEIPEGWTVFACTVRVVYTWRGEKYSKTMPCDVWKMDFGGFAWRLDSKAALCLGR
ncbi:OLC1v1011788C1 [Oldenlandia corymbosa var. corymbosa]|uniref:OLC1v1011788C1 n=1 Tax=Oldenlandia corymbosa var. corymbosa TaxID=529605 RepID=A0AAV1DXM9_OLDCO|nr:OLC1v1011788C1 [Oldenlandia corymbosa var. corymbosa]